MQAETAVLLAAAGPTYQAAAAAGMAPGDTVLLLGSQGPGDLPSRLLDALGIRAVPVPAPADHPSASGGTALPRLEDLPSARRHLLDLAPTEESVGLWAPLAAACISCTLVGPVGPAHLPRAEEVLGGQTVVRRVRDLHPHLALDLAALVMHRRIDVGDTVEIHDLGGIADTLAAFARGEAGPRWPVMARAGQR
jgi:hypothetical protein